MKISGKFILKVAGTLTVISLVVALLLGLVNGVTKDKIAAIEAEKTRVAMSAVVPEGSEFTDALEIPQAAIDAAKAPSASCTASPTAAQRPAMWPRLPLPAPRAPSP
jgi:Na+-translocating ferredoxin:NAD+ oxidoreductase RnfG subunit